MKVVVGGPPHSGKSTFTAGLVERVRERQRNQPFDVSFTWMTLDVTDNSLAFLLDESGDVSRRNEEVEWSEENARVRRATFEGRDEQLVVADAPGRLTHELNIVIEPADAMVVLASDEKRGEIDDWRARADRLDVAVRWVIVSVLDGDAEPGWRGELDSDGEVDRTREPEAVRRGTIRSISRSDYERSGPAAYDDTSSRMLRQLSTELLESAA